MSAGSVWLSDLGRQTFGVVWGPLLLWTALALGLLGALHLLRNGHPTVHEKARSALLLSLPLGVLLAVLGRAGWLPTLEQPLPLVDWVVGRDPVRLGAPITAGEAVRPTVPVSPAAPPGTFWWGVAFLLGVAAATGRTIKAGLDLRALGRLRRRLRFVSPATLGPRAVAALGSVSLPRRVQFAVTGENVPPLTFGILHPTVVLPDHLLSDPDGLEIALAHELMHARRRDVLFHTLEHLVTLVFAVHPLVHLLRAQTRRLREMACDADLLADAHWRSRDYAEVLLRLADRADAGAPALRMFETSTHLKRRIIAMSQRSHDPVRRARARWAGWTLGLSVALCTAAAVACSDVSSPVGAEEPASNRGDVTFRRGSFEAALAEARRERDGRLLVYFYGEDASASETIERHLFGNPDYADLLTDAFVPYAVRVDSPEGLRIMQAYRVTSHTRNPLLMVVQERHPPLLPPHPHLPGVPRAVLMTTLSEVDSERAAAAKMRQIFSAGA